MRCHFFTNLVIELFLSVKFWLFDPSYGSEVYLVKLGFASVLNEIYLVLKLNIAGFWQLRDYFHLGLQYLLLLLLLLLMRDSQLFEDVHLHPCLHGGHEPFILWSVLFLHEVIDFYLCLDRAVMWHWLLRWRWGGLVIHQLTLWSSLTAL